MIYFYVLASYVGIASAVFGVVELQFPLWPVVTACAVFQSALIGSFFDTRYFKYTLALVILLSIQYVIYPAVILQDGTVVVPQNVTVAFEVVKWGLNFASLLTIMLCLFNGFLQVRKFIDEEAKRRIIGVIETSKAAREENEKVSNRHDEFESGIHDLMSRRDSRVKLNFATAKDGSYKDSRTQQAYAKFDSAPAHERTSDNFMLSLMVGMATDSAFLGYAAGGSLAGGMLGAGMAHHDSSSKGDHGHISNFTPSEDVFETSKSRSVSSTWSSNDGDSMCRASDYSSYGSSNSSSDSGSSSSDSSSSSSSSSD